MKPLRWIGSEVKSPPFSTDARVRVGGLLRQLQQGVNLGMPHSRPMPSIGPGCHELRVRDSHTSWRIIYQTRPEAILILNVFKKSTRATPKRVIAESQRRIRSYER